MRVRDELDERLQELPALRPDRPPDRVITNPSGEEYLRRWFLVPRNVHFNVYYHQMVASDYDAALHDHPWPSFSYMVSGRLLEHSDAGSRVIRAGDSVFRDAEFAHRLELIDGEPAETVFVTGSVVRQWGFHCDGGWRSWPEFHEHGGCGE